MGEGIFEEQCDHVSSFFTRELDEMKIKTSGLRQIGTEEFDAKVLLEKAAQMEELAHQLLNEAQVMRHLAGGRTLKTHRRAGRPAVPLWAAGTDNETMGRKVRRFVDSLYDTGVRGIVIGGQRYDCSEVLAHLYFLLQGDGIAGDSLNVDGYVRFLEGCLPEGYIKSRNTFHTLIGRVTPYGADELMRMREEDMPTDRLYNRMIRSELHHWQAHHEAVEAAYRQFNWR